MTEDSHDVAWKEVVPLLRRALECPVCLDTIKAPVRQCGNGHVTCSLCAGKINNCSLCRRPFLHENPSFVNSLLEALPRSCRHGCGQVFTAGNTHEDLCGFRPILCRNSGCTANIKLNQTKNHHERNHFRCLFVKVPKINLTWNNFHLGRDQKWDIPVFLNGRFFYVSKYYSEKEKVLKIIFESFPIQESPFDFFVNVMLEIGDFVSHNTIKSIVRKGDVDKSGFDIVAEITENNQDFCMKVSKELLSKMVSHTGLRFSYLFFKQ